MTRELKSDPKKNEIIIRVSPEIKNHIVYLSNKLGLTQTDIVMSELQLIYKEVATGELTDEQFA
jgi:predicted DNA-binding protein